MKSTLLLSMLMVLSVNNFAQAQTETVVLGPNYLTAKLQVCTTYFETSQTGQSESDQVDQIISVYNTVFVLNYDAAQAGKLKAKYMETLQLKPKKIEDMHNVAYFGCITDIKAEDIEQARHHFASVVK